MAEKTREKRTRKLLLTLLVVGIAGSLAGIGTFSAFSGTTVNSGNTFQAGTVYLTDNDSGSALYTVSNAAPGYSEQQCITVTYQGTLPATVKLYGSGGLNAVAAYVHLTVEQGSGAAGFRDCTGFSASGTVYDGTLAAFNTTYGTGYDTNPGPDWTTGESLDYKFTVSLVDNNNANGGASQLSTGAHSFTWEARNV